MSLKAFESTFYEILSDSPLPNGHIWKLQPLKNASFRDNRHWFEVLYRTRASYQCNHGHYWQSSWSMILFRFHLDVSECFGRVRMKRFGQRCNKCINDNEYHIGRCDKEQVWYTVQRLLLNILQRCYEKRRDCDVDMEEYIIPVSDVPNGRFGGIAHQKNFCEACAHNRCQKMFNKLTKKK
ncbi:unnamed protein product [Rotaria sordida]|uniref:3CxxC-type domain-containing protein n=1 Tax=Rotaria sordida TaxID=392033 RepID=A0A813MVB8_9BILA|nr:unnamed protein product [Rotaria sordida]